MSMRSRAPQARRVRRSVAALLALLSSAGLARAASAGEPPPEEPRPMTVEERVARIRAALEERQGGGERSSGLDAERLAQWFNFPNWPNFWNNWNNFWRNF
jgi:hypothetical protein